MASKRLVKLNSRIGEAFKKIGGISDTALSEFSSDISKMARQLLKDKISDPRSTGDLEASIVATRHKQLSYSVDTGPKNESGYGYGAAQEWGWKRRSGKRKGKKRKGKAFIVRATFGMIARWKRGERWRD